MKANWNKMTILLAAVSAMLPSAVFAQGPGAGQDKGESVSKVVRKGKAPVSKEVLKVTIPKPFETKLSNGMTVLIMEDHRFPTITVQLNISGAGGIYETAEYAGLASMSAQMLREGTKTRSSKQIAEEVDKLGAALNVGAGFGSAATGLTASGLTDNVNSWMELAVDVLMNPTFPAEEWNRLKARTKGTLRQQRTQPQFLANEQFSRVVYGAHPASRIAATPESLDKITPELMMKWHDEKYAPQNSIIAVGGDVNAKEFAAKLEKWFGGWKKNDYAEVLPQDPGPSTARKIVLVDRPGSVQTNLQMGNLGINRKDPDYIPLVVMNRVLGDGPAARLFLNLREEKGYTYGVYSSLGALKHKGTLQAGGSLRTEVTDGAMTEFMKEFNRIRDEKVPEAELEEAKHAVVAGFALSIENTSTILGFAIQRKIYGFTDTYWDNYPAKVLAVTAEDVQRVARKYLDVDHMQIVAVGDGSKIKTVMEKFGPVEMLDTEGKPVAAKSASSGEAKQ